MIYVHYFFTVLCAGLVGFGIAESSMAIVVINMVAVAANIFSIMVRNSK